MVDFSTLVVRDSQHSEDHFGRHVLDVKDPHALVQAAGYLKHRCSDAGEAVYFRGQADVYESLAPSLFRGIGSSQHSQSIRSKQKNDLIEEITKACPIFNKMHSIAHEPLVQHYGLQTTWLDLVDNIWVALWFACHRAHSTGKPPKYMHFERRNPFVENDTYAYILLIGTETAPTGVPGFSKGEVSETIDLRIASPSIFLRPHAQHGLLFRLRGQGEKRLVDYSSSIRGTIRIDLRTALDWLGDAPTLSTHSLFPPPYYDQGYKILLDGGFGSGSKVGSVLAVGA